MSVIVNAEGCRGLTVNREAGGGAPGAVWKCVKLTGVAGLVLHADLIEGQFGFSQSLAQTDPTFERLLRVVAVFGVGGDLGSVALLGRLPPQHLANPLTQAVPARQSNWSPNNGRPVALQVYFT